LSAERGAGRLLIIARTIRWLSLPIILFWVGLTAVLSMVAPQLNTVAEMHAVSLDPNDAPSMIAMKRIGKDFQQFKSDTIAMVVLEGQDELGDGAHRFYDTLIAKLSEDKAHIEHIENFWGDPLTAAGSQSVDRKAAYVELNLAGDQSSSQANESVAAAQHIVDSVPPPPGIKVYLTGPGPMAGDLHVYSNRSLEKITVISIAVISIVLLVVYRSVVTVLLMLLTVGIELQAAKGLVSALVTNDVIVLSSFAVGVLVALAIAASTDYSIFLIGRYQEARAAGQDRETAYYSMFRGTGPVVLGSGLTVAGAMYCLSFTRLPYFETMGSPCSIAVLVVTLASLTLAPAIVVVASRFGGFEPKRGAGKRRWRRIGTVVVRWPGAVLVATALISMVGLLALPQYQTNYNERDNLPDDAPSTIGYHASDRHFPPARMEPEVLMIETDHDLRNPTSMLILDRIAKGVFHLPGIARVQTITRPLGDPIDHTSIPFQISMQSATTTENIAYLNGSCQPE
jgi:RND superfamily putative drug exporter